MPKPNFFLVGAPRCGTTSMYSYLSAHPEIFMSKKKEPHFFGQDLYDPSHIRSEVEYLALFDDAKEAKIVGEASVWSLSARFQMGSNIIALFVRFFLKFNWDCKREFLKEQECPLGGMRATFHRTTDFVEFSISRNRQPDQRRNLPRRLRLRALKRHSSTSRRSCRSIQHG